MKLDNQDLRWAILRLPSSLKKVMKEEKWRNKIFVGGGYLRAIVSGEQVNDVDVFVSTPTDAELLSHELALSKKDIYKTDNAYTIKSTKIPIQIIHRWVFDKAEDVAMSFDFTICCAVVCVGADGKWDSYCDDRFYIDLASKRLIYRCPVRNEDAGGSILRVLKYYQKGYRIPLDSLGKVIARLVKSVNKDRCDLSDEYQVGKVITGLLREVDPEIDPLHLFHLGSETEIEV